MSYFSSRDDREYERDILNIIRKGDADNMPDFVWTVPTGYTCVFISGKVFFDKESAFAFYKERQRLRDETVVDMAEDFKQYISSLPRIPSLVVAREYLKYALNREVAVPEMGRWVKQATYWFGG
jgi:hypothetical protein